MKTAQGTYAQTSLLVQTQDGNKSRSLDQLFLNKNTPSEYVLT